jgi:hypothetical protein
MTWMLDADALARRVTFLGEVESHPINTAVAATSSFLIGSSELVCN